MQLHLQRGPRPIRVESNCDRRQDCAHVFVFERPAKVQHASVQGPAPRNATELLGPFIQDGKVVLALGLAKQPGRSAARQFLAQADRVVAGRHCLERRHRGRRQHRADHGFAQLHRARQRTGGKDLVLAVGEFVVAQGLAQAQAEARRALQRILKEAAQIRESK